MCFGFHGITGTLEPFLKIKGLVGWQLIKRVLEPMTHKGSKLYQEPGFYFGHGPREAVYGPSQLGFRTGNVGVGHCDAVDVTT